MTTLSHLDPTAEIVCTLPVNEAGHRLHGLQKLIADRLDHVTRDGGHLRIRIERGGQADLEAEVIAFAEAEKACCAFLGFAIQSEPEAVTLEISAPARGEPTLEGIEWIVQAASHQESPT